VFLSAGRILRCNPNQLISRSFTIVASHFFARQSGRLISSATRFRIFATLRERHQSIVFCVIGTSRSGDDSDVAFAARIAAGRLQMAIRNWANPDLFPGRRNCQRFDPRKSAVSRSSLPFLSK